MNLAGKLFSCLCLIGVPVLVVLPWCFDFPFALKPATDRYFGQTALKKDDAFSKVLSTGEANFERAVKPRRFSFPKDHGPHERFRSEWWYFTGNLNDRSGRKFGYELTFFRFALSDNRPRTESAWRSNQLYMAHLALTDVESNQFYADERFGRAGAGLAGADSGRFHVWLYDWSARTEGKSDFPLRLKAANEEIAIDLLLSTQKGPVLQGDNGLSQKSAEPGNASYYYSFTRLSTQGRLKVGNAEYLVSGASWMDREWSTSALSKEQSGWDWFALQLSDGSELMYYRLRRKDGRPDPHSSGSLVLADGSKLSLAADDVELKETSHWRSPHSQIDYPSKWQLSIPKRKLEMEIMPLISDQELNLTYRYWEGAVGITGRKNGQPITGQGYAELAGYQ